MMNFIEVGPSRNSMSMSHRTPQLKADGDLNREKGSGQQRLVGSTLLRLHLSRVKDDLPLLDALGFAREQRIITAYRLEILGRTSHLPIDCIRSNSILPLYDHYSSVAAYSGDN